MTDVLLTAKYGMDVDVIAFEPLVATYTRLQANIELNALSSTMKAFPAALSDSSGFVDINVTGDNPLPSGSSIDPHPSKSNIRTETIQLTTGIDFFTITQPLNKKIGLIKIDVERHELHVIRGMSDIIRNHKPICIIELLTPEEARLVFNFMRNLGYTKIYQINDRPNINDKLYDEVDDNVLITSSKTNFLFKP
jgi:FkbM family methyltransferase